MSLEVNILKNNLSNFQRTFRWEFDILSPKGSGTADLWNIRVVACEEPGESYEVIEVPYKGTAGIVLAGRRKLSHEFVAYIEESEDAKSHDAIKSWLDAVGTSRDADYKTDAMLTKYAYGVNTPTKTFQFHGIWVSNKDKVEMVSDKSDRQRYAVTFAFDDYTAS